MKIERLKIGGLQIEGLKIEGAWRMGPEKAKELQERTKEFAIGIIQLFRKLPRTEEARVLGRQLLRAGTSVAANYRAACRARSKAEFAAKIGTVIEETDEAAFWLELMVETGIVNAEMVRNLVKEADELLAIFVASRRTAREGMK